VPDEWTYDGHDARSLSALLDLPLVVLRESVGSALDVAHALAASDAPAGTLVMADEQTAGRGRSGRRWASARGAGIWLALIERPVDASSIELLSLRVGLRAAPVLDRHAGARVSLKWPNDIYVGDAKLAGVLVEARWRDDHLDWVAIGMGINVRAPDDVARAAALAPSASRALVLSELIPALRSAATARGSLTSSELSRYAERDMARGRRCTAPERGVVLGIDARGCLLVETDAGVAAVRSGSLLLESDVA
jgi:BirA family biotin operon repressor/biotin-[acetyl-CoA-carboxylase] ligase